MPKGLRVAQKEFKNVLVGETASDTTRPRGKSRQNEESQWIEVKKPAKAREAPVNTLIGEERTVVNERPRPFSRQSQESDWNDPPVIFKQQPKFKNVLTAEEQNSVQPKIRKSRQNEQSVEQVETRKPLQPSIKSELGALPRQNEMKPGLQSNIMFGDDGINVNRG